MQTKQIKLTKVDHLAEIFQAVDVKFSFVNDNLEQVTIPAKCRDFLGDCFWSKVTGNPVSIWGFSYSYKNNPYSNKVLRLSLKFPSLEEKDNFINNLSFLHEKEKRAKTSLTKVFATQEKDTLLIEASKVWQSAVWKISLYTYYLKVISYKNVNQLAAPENKYSQALTKKVEDKLLSKIKGKKSWLSQALRHNHDNSGFYSLIKYGQKQNPDTYKYVFGK